MWITREKDGNLYLSVNKKFDIPIAKSGEWLIRINSDYFPQVKEGESRELTPDMLIRGTYWLVRRNGRLALCYGKPLKNDEGSFVSRDDSYAFYVNEVGWEPFIELNPNLFPNVRYRNSPMELRTALLKLFYVEYD